MLGNLLTTVKDWLTLTKYWLDANWLKILMGLTVAFIYSYFLFIFSQWMSVVLKYTIKWGEIFFKVLGVLIIGLLLLTLVRAVLDPNRVCHFKIESVVTKCRWPPPCPKGCVDNSKPVEGKEKRKNSKKSGKSQRRSE